MGGKRETKDSSGSKNQEHCVNCGCTHIRGHGAHNYGSDESWQGGSSVGDAEERAGVVWGQVGMVDHVGGEGESGEAHSAAESEDSDVFVGAVYVSRGHQKGGRTHQTCNRTQKRCSHFSSIPPPIRSWIDTRDDVGEVLFQSFF